MMQKLIPIIILFSLSITIFGQINPLIIPFGINLPKDSIITNQLIKSLNEFLNLKEKANSENTFVLKDDLLETSALLDEIKEIEKDEKLRDNNFYKGYLTNIVQLDKTNFLIQFVYIGINENISLLRAGFEILAKQKDNNFYFSSPLKPNTVSWKSKKIGSYTFYYKNSLNIERATEYEKNVAFFDNKLNAPTRETEFYCCDNFPEVLQLVGITYKSDYNGLAFNGLSSHENNKNLSVNGTATSDFNTYERELEFHDLWHARLHAVISPSIINMPVDEGCAYLYAGCWALSWKQILKIFKEKVASNPKSDWLSLYENSYNFGESPEKYLIVGYVINALIVEKIEKEKGFASVIELLSCGNFEKGNENYFKALEKLTGINKSNFNDKVWTLIKNS